MILLTCVLSSADTLTADSRSFLPHPHITDHRWQSPCSPRSLTETSGITCLSVCLPRAQEEEHTIRMFAADGPQTHAPLAWPCAPLAASRASETAETHCTDRHRSARRTPSTRSTTSAQDAPPPPVSSHNWPAWRVGHGICASPQSQPHVPARARECTARATLLLARSADGRPPSPRPRLLLSPSPSPSPSSFRSASPSGWARWAARAPPPCAPLSSEHPPAQMSSPMRCP